MLKQFKCLRILKIFRNIYGLLRRIDVLFSKSINTSRYFYTKQFGSSSPSFNSAYQQTPRGHNHGSVTHTSCAQGHVHQCLDIIGPSVPTPDGNHVHEWDFHTTMDAGHRHHVTGPDMPAQ